MRTDKVKVGVIGCGNISLIYLPNLTKHYTQYLEVAACADIIPERAKESAEKNGIARVCTTAELLADPEIEFIVNLTTPANHYPINKAALEAGKHVYCEKPLALSLDDANELVKLAAKKGLFVGSAPDTYLGAGLQTCRQLIDEGVIGRITGFTANLVGHGSELWHPAPHFLYQKGAGPMLDMGPYYVSALVSLLGPIKEIFCYARTPEKQREIQGEMFDVEVATSYTAVAEFKNGAVGNLNMSFDIWRSEQPRIEIYGTKGALYGPDPNMFKGPVKIYDGAAIESYVKNECHTVLEKLMGLNGPAAAGFLREEELRLPTDMAEQANMRGMGVSDMCSAILHGRKPRISAEFSRHVVEALTGFMISSNENKPYVMTTTCERPEPVPAGMELWQMD